MKYIIIEDEKPNRLMLETMVSQFRPSWQLVNYFEQVTTAVAYFKSHEAPDLIFCDIQLKDDISFEIFAQVDIDCPIIFVTAYDEYAIRAFEVKSIDYLLKPLEEKRLLKAILKFEDGVTIKHDSTNEQINYTDLLRDVKQQNVSYRKRFLISKVDGYFKLDASDIAYFYSESGVTSAVLFNGRIHTLNINLGQLELQMDPYTFFRASRSVIVNIEAVGKLEDYFGGKLAVSVKPALHGKVFVSRLKAVAFKNWLDQ